MKITDPVLVPDVSNWCDHINPKEFEDGGCGSVVVGLYPTKINGKVVLHPTCRQQCVDVATKSQMVLQCYFWDDIILDPIAQADWLVATLQSEGLPVKFVWCDQEQWWTDWNAWYLYRRGQFSSDYVPKATPGNISLHYANFARRLHDQFAQMGVYTNKGFVSSWTPPMDTWLPQYWAWVPQYERQPVQVTAMTWTQLKANWLPNYDIVLSAGQLPAQVVGHQFTGDVCILPGAYDAYGRPQVLDVSAFSQDFISQLRAGNVPTPPPPAPTPTPTYHAYRNLKYNL
ncbi:MAG: hypothetical protein ABSF99_01110, partial [Anaerolineales bacterium]